MARLSSWNLRLHLRARGEGVPRRGCCCCATMLRIVFLRGFEGVSDAVLLDHYGWDIGALGVARGVCAGVIGWVDSLGFFRGW